jgi:hypothetical protein
MAECSISEPKKQISINFVQEVPHQGLNHEFKSRLYQADVKKTVRLKAIVKISSLTNA